jgi:hypothetical protein
MKLGGVDNAGGMCYNTRAEAHKIANLIKQGREELATALRNEMRQGQSKEVNNTLDRMISGELQMCVAKGAATDVSMTTARTPSPKSVSGSLEAINKAGSGPLKMPDTKGMTTQQKFNAYASIVNTRGSGKARKALADGDAVILGLRKETNTLENRGKGVYDDRMVVIRKDKNGKVHVDEFNRASTEPSAQYDEYYKGSPGVYQNKKTFGEDADGDNIRDPGRLAVGTIEMRRATHSSNPRRVGNFAMRPTLNAVNNGKNGVERDTNHDGLFDENDKATAHIDLDDSFKIHSGYDKNTYSAGCQVIHPDDYKQFQSAATAIKGQGRWQYVLTEVSP